MKEYIEERGGGLYVAGTRVSLASVVLQFRQGAAPESILQNFPALASLEMFTAPLLITWRMSARSPNISTHKNRNGKSSENRLIRCPQASPRASAVFGVSRIHFRESQIPGGQ